LLPLVKKEGVQQASLENYPNNATVVDHGMYSQHDPTTVDATLNTSPLQIPTTGANQQPPPPPPSALGTHYGIDASYPLDAFKDYKTLAVQQHHAGLNPVLNAMNNPLLMRTPTNPLSQEAMKALAPPTTTQYHQPPLPAAPLPPTGVDERWSYYPNQNNDREAKWAEVKKN